MIVDEQRSISFGVSKLLRDEKRGQLIVPRGVKRVGLARPGPCPARFLRSQSPARPGSRPGPAGPDNEDRSGADTYFSVRGPARPGPTSCPNPGRPASPEARPESPAPFGLVFLFFHMSTRPGPRPDRPGPMSGPAGPGPPVRGGHAPSPPKPGPARPGVW